MARYSWEAAQRRIEREEQRRLRELQRRAKEQAKQSALEQARAQVEEHEGRIQVLLSVHKECSRPWDWLAVVSALRSHPPASNRSQEFTIRLNAVVDRTAPEERAALVHHARELDEQSHVKEVTAHGVEVEERDRFASLGTRILAGEIAAYEEAIHAQACFDELTQLGCSVKASARSAHLIECELRVPGTSVIPSEEMWLTGAGKLSVKAMPKGRFHEIYEDFLCGSALRVARELFALLPAGTVVVHGTADYFDASTGQESAQCVLSVAFARERFLAMDFAQLDPS
jgi:hypothetical protein